MTLKGSPNTRDINRPAGCIDTGWAHGKQEKNAENILVHIDFKGIRRHGLEDKITVCLEGIRCDGSCATRNGPVAAGFDKVP